MEVMEEIKSKYDKLVFENAEKTARYDHFASEIDTARREMIESLTELMKTHDLLRKYELCHKFKYIFQYTTIDQLKEVLSKPDHYVDSFKHLRDIMPGCPEDQFQHFIGNRLSIDWQIMERVVMDHP